MHALILMAALAAAPAPGGATTAPAAVELSIDGNWQSAATVYRGWPLIVTVVARAEEGKSVTLATTGGWSASVTIRVSPTSSTTAWPLVAVGTAPSSVALGPLDRTDATWILSPDFTRRLAPGSYTVTAELDTSRTAAAGGWKGDARTPPLVIRIADEPRTLPADDRIWKPLLESRYAELCGDTTGALSTVEAWLAHNPPSVTVLSRKAALLESMNRPREALEVVGQALELFHKGHPNPAEPPIVLIEQQNSLLEKLMK